MQRFLVPADGGELIEPPTVGYVPGATFSKLEDVWKISFHSKECAFSKLLWKTSLEDLPKKIFVGKYLERMHSQNLFGNIFLETEFGKYVGKH